MIPKISRMPRRIVRRGMFVYGLWEHIREYSA